MGVFRDLTGQTWGELTFAAPAGVDSRRRTVWEAVCSCGALTQVAGTRATSGHVTSCGCKAVNHPVDISGQRYGRLQVERLEGLNSSRAYVWSCLCDCGNRVIVAGSKLRFGHSKSCGCLSVDRARTMNLTHRLRKSPTYSTWAAMWARCTNPGHKDWHNYGGRGILVCARWQKFENFLADMGHRPDKLTIERTNNEKGYKPSNCKWATRSEQARNQRRRKSQRSSTD